MTSATAAFPGVRAPGGRAFPRGHGGRTFAKTIAVIFVLLAGGSASIAGVIAAAAWIVGLALGGHAGTAIGPQVIALTGSYRRLDITGSIRAAAGQADVRDNSFDARWRRVSAMISTSAGNEKPPLAAMNTAPPAVLPPPQDRAGRTTVHAVLLAELTPAGAPAVTLPAVAPLPPPRAPVRAQAMPLPPARPLLAQAAASEIVRPAPVLAEPETTAAIEPQHLAKPVPTPPPPPVRLAMIPRKPDEGRLGLSAADGRTAIYDIEAHTVFLPDGERLEAHSGRGYGLDDPRFIKARMRGPTPPNVYDLSLREDLFHGVRAIRLNPVDEDMMFGRAGMLAHTYMLGPDGESFGCVSFKNYPAFLHAYLNGEIDRLVVVAHLDNVPTPVARREQPKVARIAFNY